MGNAAFIDQDWPEIQTPAWNSIQGEPYLMVSIPGEDEWRYRCIVPAGNSLAEVASTKNYIVIMLLVEVVGGALLSLALVRARRAGEFRIRWRPCTPDPAPRWKHRGDCSALSIPLCGRHPLYPPNPAWSVFAQSLLLYAFATRAAGRMGRRGARDIPTCTLTC